MADGEASITRFSDPTLGVSICIFASRQDISYMVTSCTCTLKADGVECSIVSETEVDLE